MGRAGKIPDDFDRVLFGFLSRGGGFVFHDGDAAEEEIGGVGHDGAAAGRDAVLRQEKEEAREELVDGRGGSEFVQAGGEGGSQLCGFGAGVFGAERGVWLGKEAAALAIGEDLSAARLVDTAGFSWSDVHCFPF